MKVEELTAGVRSNTRLVLVYMKELVYPEVLEQIRRGIDQFVIDGVLDSGIIEQLTEEDWVSPFPQFQTTERPDLAAMEVLDGRVALLCDNSPVALLLPSVFQDFMNVTEDRYNRFEIASFERVIRYAAMIFSIFVIRNISGSDWVPYDDPADQSDPVLCRVPAWGFRFQVFWKYCLWNWHLN